MTRVEFDERSWAEMAQLRWRVVSDVARRQLTIPAGTEVVFGGSGRKDGDRLTVSTKDPCPCCGQSRSAVVTCYEIEEIK